VHCESKNHPPESPLRVIFYIWGYPTFVENYFNKNMKGKTRIIIEGHLDKQWKNSFEGFNISYEWDNTTLTGDIKDEARLHGILNI
jgi:hypothetical protein